MPLSNRKSKRPVRVAWITIFARSGALVTFAFATTTASAHGDSGLPGGFGAGFAHPLEGPDHLLAMVAVGIWGAILGRPLNYALPVVFPAVMAVGGVVGMLGISLPPVEVGIGFSVLALGALIASGQRLGIVPASLIIAAFAIFHGFAHGQELPIAADPVGYSAGFVVSTGMLHIGGIGLGLLAHGPNTLRLLPRIFGAAIAAAGVWFLSAALLP